MRVKKATKKKPININLVEDHLRNFPTKFGFNWPRRLKYGKVYARQHSLQQTKMNCIHRDDNITHMTIKSR
jgi:hypothetical protein